MLFKLFLLCVLPFRSIEGLTQLTRAAFQHQFSTALSLHRKGNYQKAIHSYRFLLMHNPRSIAVVSNLAAALQSINQHDEAIQLYRIAVKNYPTHVKLRINLGLALQEIDPEDSLDELSTAKSLLLSKSFNNLEDGNNDDKLDSEALASVLTNSASIASTHQLWRRSKIEKYYLSALAVNPNDKETNQNLLLFQQQNKHLPSDNVIDSSSSSGTSESSPVCCSHRMRTFLCTSLNELLQDQHSDKDQLQSPSCAHDDFCNPSRKDISSAILVACNNEKNVHIDKNERVNKSQKELPLTRHVRNFLDCHACSHSREGRLLQHLTSTLPVKNISVEDILTTIDSFDTWHMSMGKDKCTALREAVASIPSLDKVHHLEFGAYVGYSALCVAALPSVTSVISIEHNSIFTAVARFIIEMAELGVTSKIQIIPRFRSNKKFHDANKINTILLDHWKDEYLKSLQFLEREDVLAETHVVIADNIMRPGVPKAYLDYVRNRANGFINSISVPCSVEHLNDIEHLKIKDMMEISTRKHLIKRGGKFDEGKIAL